MFSYIFGREEKDLRFFQVHKFWVVNLSFKIPFNNNKKLEEIFNRVIDDVELQTIWKCSNITAINRSGLTDHGPVHIAIVANSALRLFRLLKEAKIESNLEKDYKLSYEDAEVVVFLGAIMHDLGMSIHRTNHQEYSISIAINILNRILEGIYNDEERIIIRTEVLHAILTHHANYKPLTIEAGCVRVADALDMAQGRARIPFNIGKIDIHSVSALSIDEVYIEKGSERPIVIKIHMNNSAGIFQIDELLKNKLKNSGIEGFIEVLAEVKNEKNIIKTHTLKL
jgi:metal-dependent HD superfamily phosphatase/phosphodiesterase